MKRIVFKEEVLSNLPLPSSGYKTLGISNTGELSTIDSLGNIVPVGGTGGGSSFYEQGTVSDSINAISVSYPNTTEALNSVISGGGNNTITSSAIYSTISGGYGNTTSGCYSTISGYKNKITSIGINSSIGGGCSNIISNCYSFIGSGCENITGSGYSFIGSGYQNTITTNSDYSFIGSGGCNTITTNSDYSSISGGFCNTITSSRCSVISGGRQNTILDTATASAILSGNSNKIWGYACTYIIGTNIISDRDCTTFVNNLSIMDIGLTSSGLPSGSLWSDNGNLCIVP